MKVYIFGQKYFGEQVLRLCLEKGFNVLAVCCPADDKYIRRLAVDQGLPVYERPVEIDFIGKADLGICAHSFTYVDKKMLASTKAGWIGYHPSLLPRHRGRSSIEWALKMKDCITGGTIYWLNDAIDAGEVAYQEWCFIDPELFDLDLRVAAGILWRETLAPIGLSLMEKAFEDISSGTIIKKTQDQKYITKEPTIYANKTIHINQ